MMERHAPNCIAALSPYGSSGRCLTRWTPQASKGVKNAHRAQTVSRRLAKRLRLRSYCIFVSIAPVSATLYVPSPTTMGMRDDPNNGGLKTEAESTNTDRHIESGKTESPR